MSGEGYETYQSPYSWRYGSDEMRRLWSEAERRRRMRTVWLALAKAEHEAGLVSAEQLADLERTAEAIDIARAIEIEETTRHDVMAEILTWREQAPVGGGVLHLGATSADITDNADALRLRDGLALIRQRLTKVILALADRVEATASIVSLGWTHIQPAAPTTVGYRLASTLQDLVTDLALLDELAVTLAGKGFKGAVGTAASYKGLLATVDQDPRLSPAALEARAMSLLGLRAALITTQTYPRKTDWRVTTVLAGIAATASRFAFNLRLLQSPPFGEWSEGFGANQVGSTAMPWKRNPINAETVDSLARHVAAMPSVAWQNESVNLLERTLDDSANRRIILPEAFLGTDELLLRLGRLVDRLTIEDGARQALVDRYGPFAASERVLLAASAAGGDRQSIHERVRRQCLAALGRGRSGPPQPPRGSAGPGCRDHRPGRPGRDPPLDRRTGGPARRCPGTRPADGTPGPRTSRPRPKLVSGDQGPTPVIDPIEPSTDGPNFDGLWTPFRHLYRADQ